jgi:hypothetical protein
MEEQPDSFNLDMDILRSDDVSFEASRFLRFRKKGQEQARQPVSLQKSGGPRELHLLRSMAEGD